MKKIIFSLLIFFLTTIATISTTSCDSREEDSYVSVHSPSDPELAKLFLSIDSLHNEYTTTSRTSVVDKWGKRFTVATVDACVSIITSPSFWGTIIASTAASWAYEEYLNYVDSRFSRTPRRVVDSGSALPNSVIFPTSNPQYLDSIGFYHNLLIDELRATGVSFINSNGDIDYNSCYQEVVRLARKHGIQHQISFNNSLAHNYINSIILTFYMTEEGSCETFLSAIFNKEYYQLGVDSSRTTQLRKTCEKIIYSTVNVKAEDLIEYGTKVNQLINDSNVDAATKNELKIANNIVINSSLNWPYE